MQFLQTEDEIRISGDEPRLNEAIPPDIAS
jgi:hypothetical protein